MCCWARFSRLTKFASRNILRCCEIAGGLTSKLSDMSVADNCPLLAKSSMMPRLVGSASAWNNCCSAAFSLCVLAVLSGNDFLLSLYLFQEFLLTLLGLSESFFGAA